MGKKSENLHKEKGGKKITHYTRLLTFCACVHTHAHTLPHTLTYRHDHAEHYFVTCSFHWHLLHQPISHEMISF